MNHSPGRSVDSNQPAKENLQTRGMGSPPYGELSFRDGTVNPEQLRQAKECLDRDGFLVLRQAFLPSSVETFRHAVQGGPHFIGEWREKFANGRLSVREVSNVYLRTPEARELLKNSKALDVVSEFLKQSVYLFRDAFISKMPNERSRFPLHQDSEFWNIQPEELISLWIPLQKSDRENGVLEVVPGSHKSRYRHVVSVGDRVVMPQAVNRFLRRGAQNANTDTPEKVASPATPGAMFRSFSNWANTKALPYLSRHFKPFERFAELFVVENEVEFWNQTVSVDLDVGDCIVYLSKTIHGSRGNHSAAERIAYVPTFMGGNYTRDGQIVSDPLLKFHRVL